jgi:ferric-dicitrate binding protein FerR (iron transport regulator)
VKGRHVAPHRWAAAARGELSAEAHTRMHLHAAECDRCRQQREVVEGAAEAIADLRAEAGPELGWDEIRAKIHWESSASMRRLPAPRRWRRPALGLGVALAVAVGVVALVGGGRSPELPVAPTSSERTVATQVEVSTLPAVMTLVSGEVRMGATAADQRFASLVSPGDEIRTGVGSVAVQFGEHSAFALAPHSRLRVTRLDAQAIELVVDGVIDVEVTRRTPEQHFVVVAGDDRISVRGTRFRVATAGAGAEVLCAHGQVAVEGRGRTAVVDGGYAAAGASTEVRPLTPDETTLLARSTPYRLPMWSADGDMLALTASLGFAPGAAGSTFIDEIEVGPKVSLVRVVPGRHWVERRGAASDSSGGWVMATSGERSVVVIPEGHVVTTRDSLSAERTRSREFRAQRRLLEVCVRRLRKEGLADVELTLELGVGRSGSTRFVNVIDTSLPEATATCVRDQVARMTFQRGAEVTWRERLSW